MKRILFLAATAAAGALFAGQAGAQSVTAQPAVGSSAGGSVDFVNAKPMPLPQRPAQSSTATPKLAAPITGPSGVVPGFVGDGTLTPKRISPAKLLRDEDDAVAPQQFGTLRHPFSTARVQLTPPVGGQRPTVQSYPYRASGKLFFNIGGSTFVCSASLIKRGLVVTAAHCVVEFGGGSGAFYTNFEFVPAYHNGQAPYGTWTGTAFAMTSYINGTESCAVSGIVCPNDVAVIRLTPQAGAFPGTSTGIYGYAFGNTGFAAPTSFSPLLSTLVNQLGYPVALDSGEQEQRNDSMGYRDATNSNNTVIGSLMTGGSSGGPWLNNLGIRPLLNGTAFGTFSNPNVVIGVTSWGYTASGPKEQGASPFTSGNIVPLVNAACGSPISNPACL